VGTTNGRVSPCTAVYVARSLATALRPGDQVSMRKDGAVFRPVGPPERRARYGLRFRGGAHGPVRMPSVRKALMMCRLAANVSESLSPPDRPHHTYCGDSRSSGGHL
jgi:hypothetical protein